MNDGVSMISLDPNPGDYCENQVHQKVKRRWGYTPCGNPAKLVIAIHKDGEPQAQVKLCTSCLGRWARSFIRFMEPNDG